VTGTIRDRDPEWFEAFAALRGASRIMRVGNRLIETRHDAPGLRGSPSSPRPGGGPTDGRDRLGRRVPQSALESDPGTGADVKARLTDIARLSNMYGAVHGGCGATVLASVLAHAPGHYGVRPKDLEVHYLQPAPASGESLNCRGRVLDSTRRYTQCTGELVDDTGRVFTRAAARYGEPG
jgi:acyl-coenzyme A thioesterase PaaI-like protein